MANVVLVSHSSGLHGAERSLVEIANQAKANGHVVRVILPVQGMIEDRMRSVGVDSIMYARNRQWSGRRQRFPFGLPRLALACIDVVRFVRMWRRERPDVVVVNVSTTPAPMLAARLLGIPLLVVVRESLRSNPNLRSSLPRRLIPIAIDRWASRVVCISEYVQNQYGFDSVVVPPSVGSEFRELPSSPSVRARSSRNDEVVFIGSISREKGQLDLIEAVEKMSSDVVESLKFVIYGDGPEDEVALLRSRIQSSPRSGRLEYRGPTDSSLGVLRSAVLSVTCSRNEGFGKTTIESIMTGTPVVGYALGGTKEILQHGGGILVDPSTPEQLASDLTLAIESEVQYETLLLSCASNPFSGSVRSSPQRLVAEIEQVLVGRLNG